MRLETRKYLFDIGQAADSITAFCAGKTFELYRADELLRAAVERKCIIGEALARLDKDDPDTAALIPDRAKIIAFRNILIHGYAEIDHRIVWNVLELKLPVALRQASDLLDEKNS